MAENLSPETIKSVVCSSCDGFCPTTAKVKEGCVVKVGTREHPFLKDVICMKGAYAHKSFAHPNRILHPLKRIGGRGESKWQEVSWEVALDEIAERLQKIIQVYGAEALAISASYANISLDNGLTRRFMNLLGTPNFISGVAYCMGNTAAVSRMVYGWYPRSDTLHAKCIVLFGHDPRRHSWTLEYKSIRMAQAGGAKLIVLDPRKSENAEAADLWLPLRAGTDAAMTLGWLNVILAEELYDSDFVRDWTVGFEQFAERVREYPLERVEKITGVPAEKIAQAARMYATTQPAVIPWSPITDQQVSSTSAIRLQCALHAITGNLDIKGGQKFVGFNPGIRSDSEIELHDLLPQEQKQKQLGADQFPVFTYRGMEALGDATERVWGQRWANLISGCYMANPMAVFKAMAESDPYPVKAFFSLANNTLMSYANTQRIHEALLNQDLVVAYEHMLTPTAQLADFVLPRDSWLERPSMLAGISEQSMEPPGACKSIVYFYKELAQRMGLAAHFPWQTAEELLDYRLEPGGMTWAEAVAQQKLPKEKYVEKKYLQTGFATPSGKVELASTVLENLGFDALPYYREAPPPNQDYPMSLFIGLPDDEYYRTGGRHVPELRKRAQDPMLFVSPEDAQTLNLTDDTWARVETSTGSMVGRVFVRTSMPKGLVRVPHGWWKPESKPGLEHMSGMWDFADAQITPDADPDLIDREQGIPHLKGVRCRLVPLEPAEVRSLKETYGATEKLPRGPEGKILQSKTPSADFMADEEFGEGIEFDAVELSLYGRSSV